MSPEPFLSIEDLHVEAGGLPRVRGVSLAVKEGRFHGLLGPNGAGKTTVLRVLYRAARAQSGEVRLGGRRMADWRPQEWAAMTGALVQESGLLSGLTVRDVVEIGMARSSLSLRQSGARIDDALALVGLGDRQDQEAATLSGGEQQRAHMAQLLARDPLLYILDEPTNHLDLHYQLVLLDEVKRRGRTVIATFHDLAMAARYCDTVSVMSAGRSVATGSPSDTITQSLLHEVYGVRGSLDGAQLRLDGPVSRGSDDLARRS
ncbi:ABC transporter ATP-binding protein [Pelagovum pacificum]|uniref:ABC transporter ATP-binding protein n=1 Tax=Pelagovum pacificum TaxID=2588711 RepID=A0A5C5GDG1_9RHOB|nr:ABC transporter ATP-binding protein [Pelagovum pacificum]QQA44331.1 ABC transporter ATP-binding protein [Pelagovum pacificum]TNY32550.1 ABC transporter ATP-binding protein [Pelagovum pacificum]